MRWWVMSRSLLPFDLVFTAEALCHIHVIWELPSVFNLLILLMNWETHFSESSDVSHLAFNKEVPEDPN